MLHTYVKLPDGTQIGYGEPLSNGSVKVAVVRTGEGGFSVALCALPSCRWIVSEGYAPEELEELSGLLAGNASMIMRLAKEAVGQARAAEAAADVAERVQGGETCPAANAKPTDSQVNGAAADAGVSPRPAATGAAQMSGGPGAPRNAQADQAQEYRQAAAAVLDAASLVGRVVPGTRVGRLVNTAMPAARTVVAAAPGIVEKAAPVMTHAAGAAAEAAPKVAEKAAKGIGRLGSKLAKVASGAVDGIVDGARQATENYRRESGK